MHDYLNHTLSTCSYTSEKKKKVSKFFWSRWLEILKRLIHLTQIKREYIATACSLCVVSEPDPSQEEEGSGHMSAFELSCGIFFFL